MTDSAEPSLVTLNNELAKLTRQHQKLDDWIDDMQRRAGLGNSMELQKKKSTRCNLKTRIEDLRRQIEKRGKTLVGDGENRSNNSPPSAVAFSEVA